MNVEEINSELSSRRGMSTKRLDAYVASRRAYFGDQDNHGVQGMDSSGRPAMRIQQMRSEIKGRGGAPNLLMPIVDDFVGLKGALPQMKVSQWDDSQDAREKSAKFSRVLNTQWRQSRMDVQWYRFGFHMSALGDGCLTLNPIFPKNKKGYEPQSAPMVSPGIYMNVIDPSVCFPEFKVGWESEELYDLIIAEKYTAAQVKKRWGHNTTEDKVEVVWYIGPDHNSVIIGDTEVERVDHQLGFCPAQWFKNKMNGRAAQSDIGPTIDSHEEMQVMVLVMNDSLLETTYGQLVIKNPVNVQDDFEVGPGAEPIVIQGDGDVSRLAPSPPPQSAQMLMQNMWELIQRTAGTSPIRTENSIPGSNISGRSVHAQQGPMETRLAGWQTWVGQSIVSCNEKILWMLYTLPIFSDTEMDIFGTEKGKPFKIKFQGRELDGWFRNQIQWSAIIGSSAHERSVVGIALKDKDLVPDEWVLDQIGIEDSDLLVAQAREEAKERMKLQQSMQGPPPGAPPPGASAATSAGAPPGGAPPPDAGGAPGAQPPPGMPGFPQVDHPPTAQGFGTPNPVPDLTSEIRQVLESNSDNLMGEIIQAIPEGNGGVHITLDEPSPAANNHDRMILREAFTKAGFQRVTFNKGDKP